MIGNGVVFNLGCCASVKQVGEGGLGPFHDGGLLGHLLVIASVPYCLRGISLEKTRGRPTRMVVSMACSSIYTVDVRPCRLLQQ